MSLKNKFSLKIQLFLLYILMTALILTVVGLSFFEEAKIMLIKQYKQNITRQIKSTLNQYKNIQTDNITLLSRMLSSQNIQFIIFNKDLKPIFSNMKNIKSYKHYVKNTKKESYILSENKADIIIYITPIKIKNKKYIIQAIYSTNNINKLLSKYAFYFFTSLAITILISTGVWFLLISYLFSNLDNTIETLKKIAKGNLSLKDRLKDGANESGIISCSIKKIVGNVEKIMKQQTKFGASIAHELRTPISVLKGSAEVILKTACKNTKDTITLSKNMLDEINRLDLLCTKLLESARLDNFPVLEKTNFEIKDFLKNCVSDIKILAKNRKITIKEGLAIDIFADKSLIRQVILNLIENAIHYTDDENGSIIIDWKLLRNGVEISIKDNGEGIEKDNLSLIFEPFYKSNKKKGGVGLGLAFCKSVIEAHGGYIYAKSTPNKGSVFTFMLPFE